MTDKPPAPVIKTRVGSDIHAGLQQSGLKIKQNISVHSGEMQVVSCYGADPCCWANLVPAARRATRRRQPQNGRLSSPSGCVASARANHFAASDLRPLRWLRRKDAESASRGTSADRRHAIEVRKTRRSDQTLRVAGGLRRSSCSLRADDTRHRQRQILAFVAGEQESHVHVVIEIVVPAFLKAFFDDLLSRSALVAAPDTPNTNNAPPTAGLSNE